MHKIDFKPWNTGDFSFTIYNFLRIFSFPLGSYIRTIKYEYVRLLNTITSIHVWSSPNHLWIIQSLWSSMMWHTIRTHKYFSEQHVYYHSIEFFSAMLGDYLYTIKSNIWNEKQSSKHYHPIMLQLLPMKPSL